MNPFFRKSTFLWNVPNVANGDPHAIADLLYQAKFESVMIKAADGPQIFVPNRTLYPNWGENLRMELVQALHDRDILVIGWGFNYGLNVIGEASVAISQVKRLGLDGWVFDAESRFDAQPGAESLAGRLAMTVKNALPSTPIGACGWSFYFNPSKPTIQWHPPAVMRAFMTYCDVGIPMQYWAGKGAAAAEFAVKNSLPQWRKITNKPIIPAGRAYTGDGGTVNPAGVAAFAAELIRQGCQGYTWWSLEHAVRIPEVWAALSATPQMNAPRPVVSIGEWAQQVDQFLVRQGYTGPKPTA